MAFDYSKLREKIKDKLGSEENYSKEMGLSKASVSMKLNGKVKFTPEEVLKTCNLLSITKEEMADYFFNMLGSNFLNP